MYDIRSDFCFITDNGALCDANGTIGEAEFQNIMRLQIRLYTQAERGGEEGGEGGGEGGGGLVVEQ